MLRTLQQESTSDAVEATTPSPSSSGSRAFKRKPRTGRKSQLGMRLGIMTAGIACAMVYGYAWGTGTMLPTSMEENFEVRRNLMDVEVDKTPAWKNPDFEYSEAWVVHRALAEGNVSVCKDINYNGGQNEICIGYGSATCKKMGSDAAAGGIVLIILCLLYLFVGKLYFF